MISFELQDEIQALTDIDNYEIPNDHDFTTGDSEKLLEAAVEAVAESSDAIADSEVFDAFRSLLKHSDLVPPTVMSKLLDSISSGLQSELESMMRDIDTGDQQSYTGHKTPMEIYAFLLHWFLTAAEKVKQSDDVASTSAPAAKPRRGRGGKAGGGRTGGRAVSGKKNEAWNWDEQIPATLALISKVLRFNQITRIWTTTAERDAFINCLTRPAYHLAESEAYMKSDHIKKSIFKVICLAVKHHGQSVGVSITIMQFLQFYEHLAEPMAECLAILANEYDHTQLGDEILREIGSKNFSGGQDTKGPRCFARFLVKYAESCPRSVLRQLSLLQDQLDSEAYPIRQAIVEVIGFLIVDLATNQGEESTHNNTASDPKATQNQINQLFDLILERVLDLNSYARTKVFQVLARLTQIKEPKFPKQRLIMTQRAVAALEDKTPTVRKTATGLLIQLLETHPYAHSGGELDRETWEDEYKKIKEELDGIEGKIGNVVNGAGAQSESDEEEEEEEEGEGEGERRKKKKSKKSKSDDSMQVDGDTEPEDGGDTDEDEDDMSVDGGDEDENNDNTPKPKSKKKKLKPRKSQLDINALSQEQAVLAQYDANHITKLRLKLKYYRDALVFIDTIEGAMELMTQLLGSKTKAEALEVIKFFRVAHEYKFEAAKDGVRKMIHLVWSKDNNTPTSEDGVQLKGIRQAVLECYRTLYFDPIENLPPKEQVNRIAKNLIERTYDATLAELTSLEEMMRIMMEEDAIHEDIITKLWQVYGKDAPLPKPQRRGAIIILGMLAVARRNILMDKIDIMLKVGLGRLGKADPTLARYTCVALQRLNGSAKKVKGSLSDNNLRYPMDHPIFRWLLAAVEHPSRTKEWFGFAEQAINTVYGLGGHPDEWCNALIKKLAVRAFSRPKKGTEADPTRPPSSNADNEDKEKDPDAMNEDQPQAGDMTQDSEDPGMFDATQVPSSSTGAEERDVAEAFELSQLIFVVGHVAIKQIVFLELVEREWKRQKDEKHAADKQASGKGKASKDGEELDQVAGNAEDEIGDRIAAVREQELLYGEQSLLGIFGPMIVHICGSPHKFKNKTLRAAAILSFSKFLCVSSQFCDQHHRLLFKILETSRDAVIRSNIVIALGDVAVSFSNIIDENSNELYKGLSDPDFVVKKSTLMVLTHLILNGMIKVKGQLGEMAKCLCDPEERISDLAKLFFKELSTKENAIYNNLPDVISHLSTGEHAVEEEMFHTALKHIFGFIEKEKQAESIVERLCQRFRLTEEPRQWRDIAYCLSLLPFKSERSVKKLTEGLQYYRDKLHEPVVYDRFTEILNKARSNKSKDKPDTELDEFAKMLEEHRAQGEEDQALEKRVENKRAAVKKRAGKKSTRGKKAVPAVPRTSRGAAKDDDMYSE